MLKLDVLGPMAEMALADSIDVTRVQGIRKAEIRGCFLAARKGEFRAVLFFDLVDAPSEYDSVVWCVYSHGRYYVWHSIGSDLGGGFDHSLRYRCEQMSQAFAYMGEIVYGKAWLKTRGT